MRSFAMMGFIALSMTAPTLAQFSINEIRTGSDPNEYVEIKGTPGASLAGVTFLVIGDGTTTGATPTRTGVVEWKWTFSGKDVIGPNGYLVLRNPSMSGLVVDPQATDLSWDPPTGSDTTTGFESSDNQTYMLVMDYSGTDTFQGRAPNQGSGGQDLDTNDDGTLDVTPWSSVIDSVALVLTPDATPPAGQDWWYSSVKAGPYVSRSVVQATTGTVIAGWDYQTTTNPNNGTAAAANPNTPKVFNSNAGFGTMYLDGTNGASDWQAAELNAFTGTNLNATGPTGNGLDPATSATSSLALVGSSANGKSVTFKFSMADYIGVNVSYATRTSNATTSFTLQQWAWSMDGVNWVDIDAISGFTTNFALKTLAPLNDLDGASDAYLRLTLTGAQTTSSNNRLDNVLLLSSPVTTDTVVVNYGAPVHVFLNGTTWHYGPGSTTDSYDTPGNTNFEYPTLICGDPNAGTCDAAKFLPFCADECCCNFVCTSDPYCCVEHWDSICVAQSADCAANCTAQPCPEDLNGDHVVDGTDLGLILGAWGTPDLDLSGDGIVDGTDLGLVLGAWGACP